MGFAEKSYKNVATFKHILNTSRDIMYFKAARFDNWNSNLVGFPSLKEV